MLIIVSGPSGVGKTTVVRRLCAEPEFVRAITATTREPRPNETHGKDYFFYSKADFEEGVNQGAFLEHATIFGNCYGTPRGPIDAAIAEGKRVVADIDSQGAQSVRALNMNAVFFFIRPPSLEELRKRLEGRKSESPENLERRLAAAKAEIDQSGSYDCIVINETVEQTVEDIRTELRKRSLL